MKKILSAYIFFYLPALAGIFFSCVNEDNDNCPPEELTVTVSYSYTEPTRTVDPADIETVSLFVFDSEGLLVCRLDDPAAAFSRQYSHSMVLPVGKYQFVAWLNFMDCCYSLVSDDLVVGRTRLSDLILTVKTEGVGMVLEDPHNLYYGHLSGAEVVMGRENGFTVPVIRDTYRINIETQGLPVDEDGYELRITDRNGKLRFDNSITAEEEVKYIRSCVRNDLGQVTGSLTVLRLFENYRNAVIQFENTRSGRLLLDANLIDLIMSLKEKGLDVDFSRNFEYDIILRFDSDFNVTVTINGWTVIDDGGQIAI